MDEIKNMDSEGVYFLSKEEGCILHPYLDSIGVPTIGIGCTYYEDGQRVKMTDPSITMERALELFQNIYHPYEKVIWSVTRDDINQHQFNALVSICYNIGVGAFKSSTLLKRVNNNPWDQLITKAFLMWKNSGGKPILLERRKREANLYFKS